MKLFHIRAGVKRAGRRLNDTKGNPGHTLCGAPLGDLDVTLRDARNVVRTNWSHPDYVRCTHCFGRLLDLDFKRSERVED